MRNIIKLILPIIIPSWRFFDVIAPSPRIQYLLLDKGNTILSEWREYRPRDNSVSLLTMLKHLFWNVKWNEHLFLISCAERILEGSSFSEQSENAIVNRIRTELLKYSLESNIDLIESLQFRLILLERKNDVIESSVYFYSQVVQLRIPAGEV